MLILQFHIFEWSIQDYRHIVCHKYFLCVLGIDAFSTMVNSFLVPYHTRDVLIRIDHEGINNACFFHVHVEHQMYYPIINPCCNI